MPGNNFAKEKNQLLKTLLNQSRKKGFIRANTIEKKFSRYHPTDEEMDSIFLEFENEGIEVVFNENDDDILLSTVDDEYNTDSSKATAVSACNGNDIQAYLNEIHQYPTLTKKETLSLVGKIAEGDISAREFLINCNLKIAFSTAIKYARFGIPLQDLIQQANMGVIMAADRYNPNRGNTFSTYCIFWIKCKILDYINDNMKPFRVPVRINLDLQKIKNAGEAYYKEHMCFPSDNELADITGFSIAKIKSLQSNNLDVVSADAKTDDEMDGTLMDIIASDDDVGQDLMIYDFQEQLQRLINRLPTRHQQILAMRYGLNGYDPMTLDEVGEKLCMSRERVRQLETQAICRMRKMSGITSLYDYLHM